MKNIGYLFIFSILAVAACSPAKTANISDNNSTNNSTIVANTVNTNINIDSSQINSNQSSLPQSTTNQTANSATKPEANNDIYKQIESQQLETADPRKVTKQNADNSNPPPKKTAPGGRQTW